MNFNCGIYAIISPSGKRYIGQSVDIKRRWAWHLRMLKSNKHHCKPLQKAYTKYGGKGFSFSKIAIVPPEQLVSREQEQIVSYQFRMLYNVAKIAERTVRGKSWGKHTAESKQKISDSLRGKPFSEERRQKISLANMGRPTGRSGSKCPTATAVICIDKNLEFPTQVAAANWLRENGYPKAKQSNIGHVCLGKGKYAYGYRWKFANQP